MDETLERSIQILNNAISSQGKSLLRSEKNAGILPRQSLLKSNLHENVKLSLDDFSFANSFCNAEPSRLNFTQTFIQEQDYNDDIHKILDRLYLEFFEVLQNHENSPQIFITVSELIQSCGNNYQLSIDHLEKTLGKAKKLASNKTAWLQNERNIWRLVYCLYHDRLNTEENPEIEQIPPNIITEKQCVENLYKTDAQLRQWQLIVDWLEKNAADDASFVAQVGHYTDKTIGWENTFHQLNSESTLIAFPSTRPLITQLDPDAPLREEGNLHDLDIEDDEMLCAQIFGLIRSGKLNEAQALCDHCGHPWRAAILEGWRLFHDPNYGTTENPGKKFPVEGNPNRSLWKLQAYEISENPKLNINWRASLAVLSGNLKVVLEVCKTWQDFLWAYLKIMIDIKVESEIRVNVMRNYVELPDEYWRNRLNIDDIFMKLSQFDNDFKTFTIPKYIILDKVNDLLSIIKNWIVHGDNSNSESTEPQMLRFWAHLVLVFRYMGVSDNETSGDFILENYVRTLITMEKRDFVAFYTSMLSQPKQISTYGKFLEGIIDNEERKQALILAEEAELDVEEITKYVVESIRSKDVTIFTSNLTNLVTPSDLMKISAIDWLTFYESQRFEAILQTNSLIRFFLAQDKLDAARQAYEKIPPDSVDLILSNYELAEVPDHIETTVREFLSHKAYLDGQEAFTEWFRHYNYNKPKPPPPIADNCGFSERVAQEHRQSQYKAEFDRWKLTMENRTRTTKTLLYNILLFPNHGWLVDNYDVDSPRAQQMKDLREVCIPKVVMLLHTVLHESEEYQECIRIADLISAENKELYSVFNKNKLRDLLKKIGESSLALMDSQRTDPWGYPLSS